MAWNDTKISSWNELVWHLHSPDLVPQRTDEGGHFRSPFVFRGQVVAGWQLKTSLQRLGTPPHLVERPLLRNFKKYSPPSTFQCESDWDLISLGQHNGLPTRLLDWSASPLIAAHFATDDLNHKNEDGVIWCINAESMRNSLPESLFHKVEMQRAWVYDVKMLSSVFETIDKFDLDTQAYGRMALLFEPPSIDARIQNQFGLLSIMNGSDFLFEEYAETLERFNKNSVRRLVISKSAKSEIRSMLDQNNISERMLYPGLPGLAAWLKRYYAPA